MLSPVTGCRKGATSKARCIDVAALVASAVLRRNRQAEVIPFAEGVREVRLRPGASVMSNAEALASIGGGGTMMSAPLDRLIARQAEGSAVIFISDNQSWMDPRRGQGPALLQRWNQFRKRNPEAKLVCIDIQPYADSQVAGREDILNVGGFSDSVFPLVREFLAGRLGNGYWAGEISKLPV